MIILKSTQEKLLSILKSVSGIFERQYMPRVVVKVLKRPTDVISHNLTSSTVAWRRSPIGMTCSMRLSGFFSSSKANLRNAP
jgi:hypothetical protein